MIATIDVQITASNPTIPLYPWRSFRGSSASIRIRNVPRKIGKWNIAKVSVQAHYPDNTITTHDCTLVGGVWIVTMPACDIAGNVSCGYSVIAKGQDETGNGTGDYILGRGDISIIDCSVTSTTIPLAYAVTLHPSKPDNPKDGDIWLDGGVWQIYYDGDISALGISKDDVETMLNGYVPATRKVNGKSLEDDINLTASDVGALGDRGQVAIAPTDDRQAQITIKGDDNVGGGVLVLDGNHDTGGNPARIEISQPKAGQGGKLIIYGGEIMDGAKIELIDSEYANDIQTYLKSEITIGDINVRQSINAINDKLAPVTSTLADYISTVVTSTYANANTKEY